MHEKHYCNYCNQELTEDEAYDTFDKGCKFCGQIKGFITLPEGQKPIKLPDTYLDCYLSLLQRYKNDYCK